MPGFLGGSSGSSGTGGEITFPKEFIDPVTKLRVSQPENLIDTDFEYGLQPTKWETVELINNTPSFFSKSGDTTIPGIVSISTNNGTREITVTTATDHGLAVGIPINVTGTKSVTADGSYVINSIPNTLTFTYLCKDEQIGNNSIEDLYSSIITGEFFQGSQIRISDAEGVTTDAEAISTLTVKTDSTHGFGLNTPFYFLNLNSTISQEFEASNTAAKSFDSSNSATAQTFDGSNTLSTFNIDWSNSATFGGTTSNISGVSTTNDTITVTHGAETFASQPLGTPLYYNLTSPASSGYFSAAQNPRGVVFLKTTDALNSPAGQSTFQVSAVPDGTAIDITSEMSGTFQLANQARTFSGNNVNPVTQTNITVIKDTPVIFDGGNQGFATGTETNGVCSVEGYAATILVSTTAGAGLDYYIGAMVKYEASGGSAPAALTSGNTYFIASFTATVTPNQYRITLKEYPDSATALAPTGGTATTQTFTKIGVSVDKNIVHVRNANFADKDMVEYSFPAGEGGRFAAATLAETKLFYFISKVYDAHNYELSESLFTATAATGGTVTDVYSRGRLYRVHTFTTVGNTNFVVSSAGTVASVEYLIVGGGGGGGGWGGGGGGGGFRTGSAAITAQTYTITVGAGGARGTEAYTGGGDGGNSSAIGITSVGGGGGGWYDNNAGRSGGSGGGSGSKSTGGSSSPGGGAGTAGQGFAGGTTRNYYANSNVPQWYPGGAGGGGAGAVGGNTQQQPDGNWGRGGAGGAGLSSTITGGLLFYAGGGGGHSPGSAESDVGGEAFFAPGGSYVGGNGGNYAFANARNDNGNGGATDGLNGRGGGGGAHWGGNNERVGAGGSGVVILRYPLEPSASPLIAPVATGGSTTTTVVGDTTYRVHSFTTAGSSAFTVTTAGNTGQAEYLIVGGGGGGGGYGGGGGAGGFLTGNISLTATTYPVVVGAGGARGTQQYTSGGNGGNSSVFGVTAIGGGGGGHYNQNPGLSGGSGGGGGIAETSGSNGGDGGAGTAGQGNNGGRSVGLRTSGVYRGGGGGGGAGGPGSDSYSTNNGGFGGPGILNNITGTATWYAGGGGGKSGQSTTGAPGGSGVGGNGGNDSTAATSPAQNTGSGGGSGVGDSLSTAGANGIVIIRYPISIAGL
jgi:hypothetical protein